MFVTAEEVLAYVGVKTPSEAETEWATVVANATNSGITTRLNNAAVLNPPPDELRMAARMAAGQAYKRREAPWGATSFDDNETAVRLVRDPLMSVAPIIDRYGSGPGIG